MNKLLFLDRDGVINIDHGHVYQIEKFDFQEGIFELLKKASIEGFKIIVVTNQGGIGKGLYTLEDVNRLHEWMINKFKEHGIYISHVYICPHHPNDNCECRKPKPKMVLDGLADFDGDPSKSVLIGDKTSDIKAGYLANIKRLIYVKSRYPKEDLALDYEEVSKLSEINF